MCSEMLDTKIKAQLIVICFMHQAGFAPDNVTDTETGEIMVTGNGIGLAWSWPEIRVVDETMLAIFREKCDAALEWAREQSKSEKEKRKLRREST